MASSKARKYCVVPQCTSTSRANPEKIFVSMPADRKKRVQWLRAIRRDIKDISPRSHVYVCEDHFNLYEDFENYLQCQMTGSRLRMKPETIPHIFNCQPSRSKSCLIRETSEKRKKKQTIHEAIENSNRIEILNEVAAETPSYTFEDSPFETEVPQEELCSRNICDVGVQTTKKDVVDVSCQVDLCDCSIVKKISKRSKGIQFCPSSPLTPSKWKITGRSADGTPSRMPKQQSRSSSEWVITPSKSASTESERQPSRNAPRQPCFDDCGDFSVRQVMEEDGR